MSRRFANQLKRIKPSMQARIDHSHFAAPDLLCCPFNELAGPPRDLCRFGESTVTGTAPTWSSARVEYNGNGLHSFGDVDWFDGLSSFTVAAYARVDSYTAAMGLLNKRAAFNSGNAFSVGWRYSAVDGYFTCGLGATTAEANKYSFQSGSPSGWNLWLAAYDSAASAGSRWRLWINAAEIAPIAEADGNGTVPNTTAPLVVGAVNSGSPLYFDGAVEWLYAWRGVRSDLIPSLLEDPYQFIDDGPRRAYFVPSVSSQTVNPAFLASAAQLFAPTLTPGEVTVSPGFLTSTAAVYAPTLTPGEVTVSPGFISSGAQLYAPTISFDQTVSPGFISSGAQLFAPTVTSFTPNAARTYIVPRQSRRYVVPE